MICFLLFLPLASTAYWKKRDKLLQQRAGETKQITWRRQNLNCVSVVREKGQTDKMDKWKFCGMDLVKVGSERELAKHKISQCQRAPFRVLQHRCSVICEIN
uniref:Putative secreted protein n=1 Tax=Anopheles darlingi TaxID=43151 RepID=A0A2M4DI24_ANODA